MAHWSSYGMEINSDGEDSCGKGHRASLLIQTGPGGRICLLCLSNLISDKNAFVIHRTYALEELSAALTDEIFCRELLNRHPQILVNPLSDAIGSSTDEEFSRDIVLVILKLCSLEGNTDVIESLLQNFIRQATRQLGCPSLWIPSKRHTLHLMGLLLGLHCKHDFRVPQSIRNEQDFVPNLICGLRLPSDALQGEILYVLYKLASLEDGIEELVHYSPQLCDVAIHALLKTGSDELRINCIALFSVLARHSLFDIRLGGCTSTRDGTPSSGKGGDTDGDSCFTRIFAEAIKGSLLSSDIHVQASALQLICFVFPVGACFRNELQIFVEEGIVDYVFEIVRLSGNRESLQSLAVEVLILLSADEKLFPHRCRFGLDTIIRVLQKSVEAPSNKLQTDTLILLSRTLSESSRTLSTAHAENLLLLLTKLLQYQSKSMQDHTLVGDTTSLPPAFDSVCMALISLLEAPRCADIPNVTQILQTAAVNAILSATSETNLQSDFSSLKHSACLLQAVYKNIQRNAPGNQIADYSSEALADLCERHLLPALTDNLEILDDEEVVLTIFQTFSLFLQTETTEVAYHLAAKLTSKRCFTVSFELMARFPTQGMKETAYTFLGGLVDKLGGRMEVCIEKALPYLPRDPTQLLRLLEERSAEEDKQLLSAHHAIIAIFSTSYSFNDRLAKEGDIVASLEQHLLINHASALVDVVPPKATLQQFVSLYASAKDALRDYDTEWSVEAETILELALRRCNCSDLICSATPKPVLRWFLQKESLQDLCTEQILRWFVAVDSGQGSPAQNWPASSRDQTEDRESEYLAALAELIEDENCGTTVLICLFDKLVIHRDDDGIRAVANTLTTLVRLRVYVGHKLLQQGFVSSVQHMIHIYHSKPSERIITSCFALLFQLLFDSDPCLEILTDRPWLDVAKQCASLVLEKMSSTNRLDVLPSLHLVNLILHKSHECDVFTEACEFLVCKRDMCISLEAPILVASLHGAKLSKTDLISLEGELLCAASIFSLLRLRWHRKDNGAHKILFIGFQTAHSDRAEGDPNYLSRSSVACEHWCKILYFGPPTLKMLASCCIAEIFSQLVDISNSEANNSTKVQEQVEMPVTFFKGVTMVLQGSVYEDSELIHRNACCCLFWLLRSQAVSSLHKRAVASSPWNRMLLENLVLSLSNPKDFGTCGLPTSSYTVYIAVGLLKMSPPPSFLSSIFSHVSITNIVANLSGDDISPILVCLFHGLLLSRYLASDHVRLLRDLFQTARRKSYDTSSSLPSAEWEGNEKCVYSRTSYAHNSSQQFIHAAILQLAITSGTKALESFSADPEVSRTSPTDSCAFTFMLDTFMQDSYLNYDK